MRTLPISVLIVSYKRSALLTECLQSLLSQSCMPSEIVIIDNSKDKTTKTTIDRVSNRKCPIRYHRNKINNISVARNKAILLAQNKFVAFLDDDCIVDRNWLRYGYRELIKDPSSMYTGKCLNLGKGSVSTYEYNKIESFFSMFRKTEKKKTTSLLLDTKNCIFDKRILKKLNINFDKKFMRLEDFDLSYALVKHSVCIVYLERMKIYHHYRNSLREMIINDFQIGYYMAMVWYKYKTNYNKLPTPTLHYAKMYPLLYRYISRCSTFLGIYVFKAKNPLLTITTKT